MTGDSVTSTCVIMGKWGKFEKKYREQWESLPTFKGNNFTINLFKLPYHFHSEKRPNIFLIKTRARNYMKFHVLNY